MVIGGLPMPVFGIMAISAQLIKVSWGPHPTASVKFEHVPQVLAVNQWEFINLN